MGRRWSKTIWLGRVRLAVGRGDGLRRYRLFLRGGPMLLLGHYMLSLRIEHPDAQ